MTDVKAYIHPTFPTPKNNETTGNLKSMHSMSTDSRDIRPRTEMHSVPGGGAPKFMSGHGNR